MSRYRKLMWSLLVVLMIVPLRIASAEVPYPTHYYDVNLDELPIQPVYVPDGIIEYPFAEPVDLQSTPNGHLFVVDKELGKVIEFGQGRELVRMFGDEEGEGQLNSPEGVFVAQDGHIYIADSGNKRIAVFKANGEYLRSYGKPETVVLNDQYHFVPVKLVVDRRGVMYISVRGADQGLVRINQDGKFLGFFGANKSNPSFMSWVKKLILTKEQMDKEVANKPRHIANISLDASGFIITASPGTKTAGNIRKLNAGGIDALKNQMFRNSGSIVDAVTDNNQFLYGLEQTTGKISMYDPSGRILLDFGQQQQHAQQSGLLIYPTSLAVNSSFQIFVADSGMKIVQVFKRTEFADTLLTAIQLYGQGRYEESKAYWGKIAARNELIDLTFQGLGKAALLEGQYKQALALFKEASDEKGYSEAFWNVRTDRIKAYFIPVCVSLLVIFVSLRLLRARIAAYWRAIRWTAPLLRYGREAKDFFYVIIHPYAGYYRLKERKISFVFLLSILIAVCLAKAAQLYGSGFIFHPYDLSQVNISNELLLLLAVLVTWIIANYLVCSVKGGEGRFREVLQASIFGMAPYMVFTAVIIPISNMVVLEESILVTAITQIMLLCVVIQFFVMTQVIHNFDFLETVKNMLITLFSVLMIWFFAALISGLSFNLYDFFYQLYREVTYYL
ncbi:YIP1 family protein [Paenibacillus eucommiae]|uniref:Tetratricopeptide (TPR) repeat protein n=1 Tax=Paenibacillus eucommiae TaxID=1355755 RepID=A0ABS4IZT6_9BACL|nr:YIP1 family protein [Paenibacillus eucommiae]MBP1993110.1 tetratricopeptide (TPR) repeat protein [Paenibacillus eucommiae]